MAEINSKTYLKTQIIWFLFFPSVILKMNAASPNPLSDASMSQLPVYGRVEPLSKSTSCLGFMVPDNGFDHVS